MHKNLTLLREYFPDSPTLAERPPWLGLCP
jgi:hypothetical protein